MSFLGKIIGTPFKAALDVAKGAWNMTGGMVTHTLGKAWDTVKNVGNDLIHFRFGAAIKDAVGGTFGTLLAPISSFLKGAGETIRGGVGLGGTAAAIFLAPTGIGSVATYAATVGAYSALGG